MVMVLPRGKYDFDLYPLTEDLVEIDDDGNDILKEVWIDGVIEVHDDDLPLIRKSKKFADDRYSIIDMTDAEVCEERQARDAIDARANLRDEIDGLVGQLASMDYLTNKYIEGKIDGERWTQIVQERDAIRRRISELKT